MGIPELNEKDARKKQDFKKKVLRYPWFFKDGMQETEGKFNEENTKPHKFCACFVFSKQRGHNVIAS